MVKGSGYKCELGRRSVVARCKSMPSLGKIIGNYLDSLPSGPFERVGVEHANVLSDEPHARGKSLQIESITCIDRGSGYSFWRL